MSLDKSLLGTDIRPGAAPSDSAAAQRDCRLQGDTTLHLPRPATLTGALPARFVRPFQTNRRVPMRIFTSWSGDRSKAAALGLKSLLQDLFEEAVQVFVSEHITPGEAWAQRLGTELEQSEFGILCLTRDNWQSPW